MWHEHSLEDRCLFISVGEFAIQQQNDCHGGLTDWERETYRAGQVVEKKKMKKMKKKSQRYTKKSDRIELAR